MDLRTHDLRRTAVAGVRVDAGAHLRELQESADRGDDPARHRLGRPLSGRDARQRHGARARRWTRPGPGRRLVSKGGGMRARLSAILVMASLAALPVGAQETRGNINGTVQDSSGVIPAATVTITNVGTGQTQKL